MESAKVLDERLKIVTVVEPLPPYASYTETGFPGPTIALTNQRDDFYKPLQDGAKKLVESAGMALECSLIAGDEVGSMIEQIREWQADLYSYRTSSIFVDFDPLLAPYCARYR